MCSKIIILNLTEKLSNRFEKRLLEQSLHHHMDQVESEFLKAQQHQTLVWSRYIDDIFFLWAYGQEKLQGFLDNFNKFQPNLKFTH